MKENEMKITPIAGITTRALRREEGICVVLYEVSTDVGFRLGRILYRYEWSKRDVIGESLHADSEGLAEAVIKEFDSFYDEGPRGLKPFCDAPKIAMGDVQTITQAEQKAIHGIYDRWD